MTTIRDTPPLWGSASLGLTYTVPVRKLRLAGAPRSPHAVVPPAVAPSGARPKRGGRPAVGPRLRGRAPRLRPLFLRCRARPPAPEGQGAADGRGPPFAEGYEARAAGHEIAHRTLMILGRLHRKRFLAILDDVRRYLEGWTPGKFPASPRDGAIREYREALERGLRDYETRFGR